MMPTWLYHQDFAKFPLNRHYNVVRPSRGEERREEGGKREPDEKSQRHGGGRSKMAKGWMDGDFANLDESNAK
ncbi:hypothetical protein TNCV_1045701 [Trichonephila clavipes]|nr:hypothetical protein TNCV_1045701 [Trichonephila clavipes]